jgi:hypothetical protein
MPDTPDKTGPNQHFARYQFTGENNNMKAQKFSLFGTLAAALLLSAAFVPKADAFVVSYFNFEDTPTGMSPVDLTPDKTVNDPGDEGAAGNPGGGIEPTTTNLTITTTGLEASTAGTLINRTPNDADTADPGLAVNLSRSGSGHTASISFTVNLEFWAGLSLSFATNNNGNGYQNVTLSWSGAVVGSIGPVPIPPSPGETITFDLTGQTALNGDGMTPKFVTFTLTFTNGMSNGVDLQTVVDNIRLDAITNVPEPSTVVGGLLGVCGLCWHQRRRLIRCVRLRRT